MLTQSTLPLKNQNEPKQRHQRNIKKNKLPNYGNEISLICLCTFWLHSLSFVSYYLLRKKKPCLNLLFPFSHRWLTTSINCQMAKKPSTTETIYELLNMHLHCVFQKTLTHSPTLFFFRNLLKTWGKV